MTIGERIKKCRKNLRMSQEELAIKLNTTKQAIYKYESNIVTNIPMDKIEVMSSIFGVTPSYLMGWDDKNSKFNPARIPVLGYVAAGIPIEAIEDVIDYEELSPKTVKDGAEYFALQIQGTSMEPKISDGDVVIVRKQPDVDSGQIAIVCVNGDRATCKKVMKHPGGILLQPLNPAYEATFYSADEVQNLPITILGRVVELRAKF
jgi:repressor LexA